MNPRTQGAAEGPWLVFAVDDEPPAIKAFARALANVPDFKLVGSCTDPMVAESLIRDTDPDVLFLDIHMPGLSGFDVIRALGSAAPLVVFVTAFDQFAIDAFEAQAVDYLLKPIDPERFTATLERLRRALTDRAARDVVPRLEALLQQFTHAQPAGVATTGAAAAPNALRRIPVRQGGRTTLLDPRTIDRIDADDNDVCISAGSQRYRIRDTLTALQARLPASLFLRVHRSCIVNVLRIQHFEPYFHGDVVLHLADGSKVISGRTYRQQVRAALGLGPNTK